MNGKTTCTFLSSLTGHDWALPGLLSTYLHSSLRCSVSARLIQHRTVELNVILMFSQLPVTHQENGKH